MMRKKFGVIVLTVAMLVGNGVLVSAAEKGNAGNVESDLLQETVAELEKGYSEYYDIQDTEMTLCCSHEEDGEVENTYLLEMIVVLKADSVEEMPYYQGAVNYCESMTASLGRLRTEDSCLRVDMLSSKRAELYDELEEYIGKKQDMFFYIKEVYYVNREEEKKILFENGMDYVSWEDMLPLSDEEISTNGYAYMENMDKKHDEDNGSLELQQVKAVSYSVSEAVSYMRRYTSNATSCDMCNGTCKYKVDTTKYNSGYAHWAKDHSDCANYLSQALCEGGIPTDNKWKAGSLAWIRVDELMSYMTGEGYWTHVSYSTAQRGDIMYRCDKIERHVMMITDFDGRTYRYSAHTNDVLDKVITIDKSTPYTIYRI